MNNLQTREKWLIALLVGSLFITLFIMLRIKPVLTQLATLKTEQKKVQKKLRKQQSTSKAKGSVKKVREELASLKITMEEESKTMVGYQQRFINLNKSGEQANLKAEIMYLIEAQGMVILDIGEQNKSLDALVSTRSASKIKDIKRPMIGLKLTGNFSMLNGFFLQLQDLPYSVVITRLSMKTERRKDLRAPYQLAIELSLAL